MKLELIRTYYLNGTNGELLLNGDKICSTIELAWKENKTQVSCIPEGHYELRKRYSPRLGKHFILMNVPDRSFILLHAANIAWKELKGCIAPVSFLTGEGTGTSSQIALKKVISVLYPVLDNGEKVFLEIKGNLTPGPSPKGEGSYGENKIS